MARGQDFGAGRIAFDQARAKGSYGGYSGRGQQHNMNENFTVRGMRRYVGPDRRGGYQGAPGTSGNYSATVTGKGPTPGTMRPF